MRDDDAARRRAGRGTRARGEGFSIYAEDVRARVAVCDTMRAVRSSFESTRLYYPYP